MKKIRFGILGTARIAKNKVIPAIVESTNAEVVAIAGRSKEKAKDFADEFSIERVHNSYEDLLNDENIDAVYIPLPTGMHANWCIKAAEASKNVLCEKPIAVNMKELENIQNAFDKSKTIIGEAYMYRFHPMAQKVKELIDTGEIGELKIVRSCFNTTIKPNDIRYSKELGGGAMLDLGCYCTGIIRYLTGEEPTKINAMGSFAESGVDTTVLGNMKFPSGVYGYFTASMVTDFDCSYEALGTEGRILVDTGGMVAWPDSDFIIKVWKKGEYSEVTIKSANSYKLMIEDYASSLLNNRDFTISLNESIANMRVIDRVFDCISE